MGPSALCENETHSGIGVVDMQKLEFLRFLRAARDPLRGSAWSLCKTGVFCDSCGPRAALCEKSAWSMCNNWSFCDSGGPCATLCGDRRGRCAFFAILAGRARPSAGIGVVDVQNCFFCAIPSCRARARPSAWIMRVGSLSLWSCANLRGLCATLCGDCACQIALAVVP